MALADLRKAAPPLFISRKPSPKAPAVRTVNPAAIGYVRTHGAEALHAMMAAAMTTRGKPLDPRAILTSITASPLDAIYPSDALVLRKMAPALTLQTDQADQGIEMVNPMATGFALATGVPFGWLYATPPALVRWAHGPGMFGPHAHGWQEINPAAIDYATRSGRPFADVYPTPPPWSSSVDGSKDTAKHYAQLVGRPFEGAGGVYVNWYHPGSSAGDWVNNAVATCGRAAGSAIGAVDQATGAVGAAIGKIPFVGGPLAAVWDLETLGPVLSAADAIAHGKAIDQAALNGLKSAIKDIHEVAPFVEAVISFVPGVGPVASGCIAAGLALASGEPIDEVMVDAAAAAIPGGAIVKAVYRAGRAVMNGEGNAASLMEAAAFSVADSAGVPVPDAAKQVITTGLNVTVSIAHGEKPGDALVNAAIAQLPPAGQAAAHAAQGVASGKNIGDVLLKYGPDMVKGLPVQQWSNGLMVGMSLGQGQMLQSLSQTQIVKSLGKLASDGAKASDAVIDAARKAVGPVGAYGFDVGVAMAQHQINRYQCQATRDALTAAQRIGYDMALSLHVGRVTRKPPPGDAAHTAGYMVAHGLAGAQPAHKKAVLRIVATHPAMARGASSAVVKGRGGRWRRVAGSVAGIVGGALVAGPAGALAGAGVGASADALEWLRTKRPVSRGVPAGGTK